VARTTLNPRVLSRALVCSPTSLVTSKTLRPLLILGIRAGAIRHPAEEIYPPTFDAPGRGQGLEFLLVFSLAMMVRIMEHRAKTLEDVAIVTEPPKSLGPPTVVLVQRTSDNPVGAPESLDKFGMSFFTFPKSVLPVTQTLQNIGDIEMRKRLQKLTFI
jgi:hypothetical protein